jgi:hypothetical protein
MVDVGVSYFGVRRTKHVALDMAELARVGATYVVHLMTETDLDNYRSTMREIIAVTKDAGLATWLDPVGVGHVFGGTEFPSELAMLRPDLAQRDDQDRPLPAACPSRPGVRAVFHDWIDSAIELGADTIFWDEPHYWIGSWWKEPERSACYCDACEDRFSDLYGRAMPRDPRDPEVIAFRRRSMVEFLAELLGRSRSAGAQNAVTVLPSEVDAVGGVSFEDVAGTGLVDNLGTDPYPFPSYPEQESRAGLWRDFVGGYAAKVVDVAARHELGNHLWIQGCSVPRNDEGYLDEVFSLARKHGITNLAVWGFDGHRDMSRFACEDPDEAWQKIVAGFERFRGADSALVPASASRP